MKVPLFILCLAVTYGACRIYAQEDLGLTKGNSINDEENGSSYSLTPLKRYEKSITSSLKLPKISLLNKGTNPLTLLIGGATKPLSLLTEIITNPIKYLTNIMLTMFGDAAKPVIDLIIFTYDVLIGKRECPQVENLNLKDLVKNITVHPIPTITTIVCYFFDAIGSQGRSIIHTFSLKLWEYVKEMIPIIQKTLNNIDKTGLLPPNISALIKLFNVCVMVMKFMGYI